MNTLRISKIQKEVFKKKFGREPGPNDPIFLDPDFDVPFIIAIEKVMDAIVEASTKAGLDSYQVLRNFQFNDWEIENYFSNMSIKQ